MRRWILRARRDRRRLNLRQRQQEDYDLCRGRWRRSPGELHRGSQEPQGVGLECQAGEPAFLVGVMPYCEHLVSPWRGEIERCGAGGSCLPRTDERSVWPHAGASEGERSRCGLGVHRGWPAGQACTRLGTFPEQRTVRRGILGEHDALASVSETVCRTRGSLSLRTYPL